LRLGKFHELCATSGDFFGFVEMDWLIIIFHVSIGSVQKEQFWSLGLTGTSLYFFWASAFAMLIIWGLPKLTKVVLLAAAIL